QTVTSATVSAGNATASFTLPPGQGVGSYTIQAVYNPGTDYQSGSDSTHTLSVDPAPTETLPVAGAIPFSLSAQSVPLSAFVESTDADGNEGGVNEGSVTFTLVSADNQTLGVPETSGTLADGHGSVAYALPAGLRASNYKIKAQYNPGPDYL